MHLSIVTSLRAEAMKTRTIVLVLLVMQTTAAVLLMRYSRTAVRPPGSGPPYLATVAVFMAEAFKLPFCIAMTAWSCGGPTKVWGVLRTEICEMWTDALKCAVPAVAYTLQSNLLFVALANLDAPTYQITYQTKTIFTALFSRLLLGRRLEISQWMALLLLTLGCVLVTDLRGSKPHANATGSRLVGLSAVGAAALLSSSSSVYFENMLKKRGGGTVQFSSTASRAETALAWVPSQPCGRHESPMGSTETAFTLHMTESSVEQVGGGNRPVAVPPQWLPVFTSSIIIDQDETIVWHDETVCIAAPPAQYGIPILGNSSAAELWCVPRTDRNKTTNIRAIVVFPLNGAPRGRDFHPYHDAMRLWWFLEFAIAAKRQGLSVLNGEPAERAGRHWAHDGEPWPWDRIGPIGRALDAALSRHGVEPVPRRGCPDCAELRLNNFSISPWKQAPRFLTLSRATYAVWRAMQVGSRVHTRNHATSSPPPPPPPLLWWDSPWEAGAGGTHHALLDAALAAPKPTHLVLLDRAPPRQLAIRGTVRRPMLREVISSNDTRETVRQWSQPAFAYVTPHGAQLNNRFLMTQQPQPCLIEVFPRGYFTPCYVLPFCPQRHVQVHGSLVWDVHDRRQLVQKLVESDVHEICEKWFPPPASGETGQEKQRRLHRCRGKARKQQVETSNSTLAAAVELCRRAIAPSQRAAPNLLWE